MKILFATYPMAFFIPGGGEVQLLRYYKYLKTKKYNVDLLNIWDPKINKYDLVHFFGCIAGSTHFCNAVKNLNIPLIISSSLWLTKETLKLYPIEEIKYQLNLADKIITNSKAESKAISELLGIHKEKFTHIYNGVDLIFYKKNKNNSFKTKFKIKAPYVLNVANIETRKNQINLAIALKKFPEFKLIIIGNIRDKNYAEELFKVAKEQLIFIGPLRSNSALLRDAYLGAEIFCLPSTLETPGLSALEAFATESKIILTKEGSTKEYFTDNVMYVDPLNIHSIEEKLDLMINKNYNVNYKHKYNFEWGKTLENLPDIYKKTIRNNG